MVRTRRLSRVSKNVKLIDYLMCPTTLKRNNTFSGEFGYELVIIEVKNKNEVCVYNSMYWCSVASAMSDSLTPWTAAPQTPLSMGFSRQEYWSGLPCPPLRDLPKPGTEAMSPALQVGTLPLSHQRCPVYNSIKNRKER